MLNMSVKRLPNNCTHPTALAKLIDIKALRQIDVQSQANSKLDALY